MKLYTYTRSSASYRLRIALEWKGIARQDVQIDLRHGEQLAGGYRAVNPQGLVPVLVDGDLVVAQSIAILEYLEERWPDPPLLPATPAQRARVRQLACLIGCDTHPLQNLRVLQHLAAAFGAADSAVRDWSHHWTALGLTAFEALVAEHADTGRFCQGDEPTLADVFLVPQLFNARRRALDLAPFPTLLRIEAECLALPAFARAAPGDPDGH